MNDDSPNTPDPSPPPQPEPAPTPPAPSPEPPDPSPAPDPSPPTAPTPEPTAIAPEPPTPSEPPDISSAASEPQIPDLECDAPTRGPEIVLRNSIVTSDNDAHAARDKPSSGIDIDGLGLPEGSRAPVYSPTDGTVVHTNPNSDYNKVAIADEDGNYHEVLHMANIEEHVAPGDSVVAGCSQIGELDHVGASRDHVHIQVKEAAEGVPYKEWKKIDPAEYAYGDTGIEYDQITPTCEQSEAKAFTCDPSGGIEYKQSDTNCEYKEPKGFTCEAEGTAEPATGIGETSDQEAPDSLLDTVKALFTRSAEAPSDLTSDGAELTETVSSASDAAEQAQETADTIGLLRPQGLLAKVFDGLDLNLDDWF